MIPPLPAGRRLVVVRGLTSAIMRAADVRAWQDRQWEPGEQIWLPGGGSYTTQRMPDVSEVRLEIARRFHPFRSR